MRLPLLPVIVLSLLVLPASAAPSSPITVDFFTDGGGAAVSSSTYSFSLWNGQFRMTDVEFAGAALFDEVTVPMDVRSIAVNGASLRVVPTPPPISDPLLHFTDSAVGELRVGLPPNPISPVDFSQITLSEGVAFAGEGTAYTLTTEGHAFTVGFESAPTVAASVISFQGTMHMRLAPGGPPI